jgi:UDP-N-acetylmuramoylalanine--D-glutamate ligase
MPNDAAVKFEDGDRALVIGVGRSGMATAVVLRDRGLRVTAYDDKPSEQLKPQRAELAKLHVELVGADGLASAIPGASVAIVSPGVPPNNPAVLAIQRAGVSVISEIEAAYRIAKAPIIAITGSKGKSTTTALIGHLLRGAGVRARVGGNIGNPLISEAAAASADEWLVAEVSSFQLEGISTFRPRVSMLLNVSPDHLDRYPSIEEYREAKFRIVANQMADDVFVGNADDPAIVDLVDGPVKRLHCAQRWFSLARDPRADMWLDDGWLVEQPPLKSGALPARIVALRDLKIRGAHNAANAMAAYLATSAALKKTGAEAASALVEGLRSFEPLAHRLQIVARSGGVTFVDDSKASNPDAVAKALEAFEAPIILIAGGRSKRTDFAAIARPAQERCKRVILIGESSREIGALIERVPMEYAASMDEAVNAAALAASPGDVVLLSPGCASFDMFDSAEQRGERFTEAATRIASLAGAS